jgi:hypothetical protein
VEDMSVRVLVTGSRHWTSGTAVDDALLRAKIDLVGDDGCLTVVHGDCPTGADAFAKLWASGISGVSDEPHPADWAAHGRAAGPIRNQEMVDLGAAVCLAFPMPQSRGTRDCMRRARAAGIPVVACEVGP